MTGFAKDARVEIVAGYLRGVHGVIDSVQGGEVGIRDLTVPPRLERADIGQRVTALIVHCKLLEA